MNTLNYDFFCSKRFDIVIRYYLLTKSNYNVFDADKLLGNKKYASLKRAIIKTNPRLIAKGIFNLERWIYVENAIVNRRYWLRANPYLINIKTNYGNDVKRLLMAIKHKVPLYWSQDNNMEEKKGFQKSAYLDFLPESLVIELKEAEHSMIEQMRQLSFFSLDQRITKPALFLNKIRDFQAEKVFSKSRMLNLLSQRPRVNNSMIQFIAGELASQVSRIRDRGDLDYCFDYLTEAGNSCVTNRVRIKTLYSRKLCEVIRQAVNILIRDDPHLQENVRAVFVSGSIGYGYGVPVHKLIEGKVLPLNSAKLFSLFYLWIFANPQAAKMLAYSRFFDGRFSSDIDLRVLASNPNSFDYSKVSEALHKAIADSIGYCPEIEIKVKDIKDLEIQELFFGRCVYMHDDAELTISKILQQASHTKLKEKCEGAITKLVTNLTKPKHIANSVDQVWLEAGDEAAQLLQSRVQDILVKAPPEELRRNLWYSRNKKFFQGLSLNNIDSLIFEDATEALNDKKGFDKDIAFTILKVRGLKNKDGEIISAYKVVLKIRGLSSDKCGVDAHLDLLKEYTIYLHLQKMQHSSSYFPMVGPLLLRINKIDIGQSNQKSGVYSGFLMENIYAKGLNHFTLRCSPSQSLPKLVKNVSNQCIANGIQFRNSELRQVLSRLVIVLASRGIQITLCDLCITFDKSHKISKIWLFDFERLSFARFMAEYHILLPTLVDVKSFLPKRGAVRKMVLDNLYQSLEGNKFEEMVDVLAFLKVNERWIILKPRILRFLNYYLYFPLNKLKDNSPRP